MKRHLCLSILVAALAAPAVPHAYAASDIVKCVDATGHVTLTDQPCEQGATMVRLASMPAPDTNSRAQPYPMVAERGVLPPPPVRRYHASSRVKAKPLKRDVVTLKAARAQFLLMDAGASKQTLATLD